MTTIAAAKLENIGKASALDEAPTAEVALQSHAPSSSVLRGEELKDKQDHTFVKASGIEGDGEISDFQKKVKRAERFGVVVQRTEEDKRNTRAERFGTGAAINGSDSFKTSEELKRKARAERFGSAQTTSEAEEAKKKARLSRFGSISKCDPVEEDKKKARAIRFSNNSSSLSKEDDEGNIQKKKAIVVDKAGART